MQHMNNIRKITLAAAAVAATIAPLAANAQVVTIDAADFTAVGLDATSMVTFATTVILPIFGVFYLLGLAFRWFRRSRA